MRTAAPEANVCTLPGGAGDPLLGSPALVPMRPVSAQPALGARGPWQRTGRAGCPCGQFVPRRGNPAGWVDRPGPASLTWGRTRSCHLVQSVALKTIIALAVGEPLYFQGGGKMVYGDRGSRSGSDRMAHSLSCGTPQASRGSGRGWGAWEDPGDLDSSLFTLSGLSHGPGYRGQLCRLCTAQGRGSPAAYTTDGWCPEGCTVQQPCSGGSCEKQMESRHH